MLTLVVDGFLRKYPGMSRDDFVSDTQISAWILRAEHKTFKLWGQFLLDDFPAYTALRTALHTRNFKLHAFALRRLCPPLSWIR